MANLTEQALAERDAARNGDTSPTMRAPGYLPGRRQKEEISATRDAFKAAQLQQQAEYHAQRAAISEHRANTADERLSFQKESAEASSDLARQHLELQKTMAENQRLLNEVRMAGMQADEEKKRHALEAEKAVVDQSTSMYRQMSDARDPSGYIPKAKLDAIAIAHPEAWQHGNNAKQVAKEMEMTNAAAVRAEKLASASVKTTPGEAIDAAKIVASPNAQYGTYNNKTFTPVATGSGDQTHVQLTYEHPTKGTVMEILPRADYETQMNARKAAADAISSKPQIVPTPNSFTVLKWTRDENGNPVPVK